MRNMPSSSPALATSAPAMAGIVAETPRFCPGMVFVGEGKRDAMLEKSRELKLEFLFMLESRVERNRGNGVVLNDIQVRLFQIASGNVIATSKPINNVEIFKNQKRRSATEVVDDAINNIFLVVDKKVKCLPMPKLPPEQVRSRIASLVIVPPPQRLASLAEIRMYHAQGSLTDDELLIAIEMLLGEQGLLLMAGTEEQQREILDTWAHRLSGS